MTLSTLIAILEEEKTSLLHLLDKAIKEEDFKLASYNLKSIRHVDRQLLLLKSLDDPRFEDKKELREIIERMKTFVASDNDGTYKEYYTKQIDAYLEELQDLNDTPSVSESNSTQLVLDDYLNKLLENKIRAFKLVLNKSENLILEISVTNGSIRVMFLNAKTLLMNNLLSGRKADQLMKLGFQWSAKGDHLFLDLKGNKIEIEDRLRILLMTMVFEVFSFRDFNGQSYVEI